MTSYQEQYEEYRTAVEEYLQGVFPNRDTPYRTLQAAMSYSLLSGGKRVRPVLSLAFCDLAGENWRQALPFGCALELVHTYSLIHDDLPCMDNDDLRRGKPTCHKVYGETMATLAGDALQAEAFRMISQAPGMTPLQKIQAVETLSSACGGNGMVAGQVMDMQVGTKDRAALTELHRLKTGAMIRGAALLGVHAAGGDEILLQRAGEYASHIGLAFQVRDDMLDVIADQDTFGKPIGSDLEQGKQTFVGLLGLDSCEALVREETEKAKASIAAFPQNTFLVELADHLANRRS